MQEDARGKAIFVMRIVWDGGDGELEVHENDEPLLLAQGFVKDKGLDEWYVGCIEKEVCRRIDGILGGEDEEVGNEGAVEVEEMILEEREEMRTTGSLSPSKINVKKNKRIDQYKKIFKFFNPDGFGKIYSERVFQVNFKHRLCRVLMPIIIDIETLGLSIGFDEFSRKIDVLINYLSENDVRYLMNFEIDLKELSQKKPGKAKELLYSRNCFSP